ncbi:MAG: hypothetical protein O2856_03430 [Planctomycetota bacterium]|nr:hypothetical protein [Planctomycetota bacterium]
MHAAAPGRRVVSLAATAIVLIPVVVWLLAFRPMNVISDQASPVEIALAAGMLLLIIGLVCWKGIAALPLIIAVPMFLSVGWSSLKPRMQMSDSSPQQQKKNEPPSVSVFSRFDGVEVVCNGVRLGETPLKITLAEFDQKVAPTDLPPAQSSTIIYEQQLQPRFASAQWSAIPGDPHQHRQREFPYNENNLVVMKWLAGQKYWWSFRLNGYTVQMESLSFGHSDGDVRCSISSYWKTLERHASLLKTLAEHENVDPLAAYADHIAAWSPPLKQSLEYQPVDAPDQPRQIHFHDQFSETPLEFTEAVCRKDWRWIARSNDPRSVPLLKLYLMQAEDQYQGNVLTFRGDVVATLIESDLPEVQSILKELLSEADWPELYLVQLFIDRQLARGVSRQEIADWLVQMNMHADRHLAPLLLEVGGDDFAKTAETLSFDRWQNALNEMRSRDLQPGVRTWLVSEWQSAPHADLMRLMIHFPSPEIVEALRNTDLSTTERALSLVSVLTRSGPGTGERTALSEAAARALAAATDQEHVSAVADVLRHLHTEIGLEALLAYDSPDNKELNRARSEVQQVIDGEKKRLATDLKLARELVEGTTTPDELVENKAFVWKNGQYEAEE